MGTRAMQFFMTPDEFAARINEVAASLGGSVILAAPGLTRGVPASEAVHSRPLVDGKSARWLFLSSTPPTPDQLGSPRLLPAKWGWVDIDIPTIEGDTLYLAQMAAKTDWLENGQIKDNPESSTTLRKITPAFRALLMRPVWVRNVLGGPAEAYDDLWYSSGAAEWVREGRQLRQRDVANLRFALEPPSAA